MVSPRKRTTVVGRLRSSPKGKNNSPEDWLAASSFQFAESPVIPRREVNKRRISNMGRPIKNSQTQSRRQSLLLKRLDIQTTALSVSPVSNIRKTRRQSIVVTTNASKNLKLEAKKSEKNVTAQKVKPMLPPSKSAPVKRELTTKSSKTSPVKSESPSKSPNENLSTTSITESKLIISPVKFYSSPEKRKVSGKRKATSDVHCKKVEPTNKKIKKESPVKHGNLSGKLSPPSKKVEKAAAKRPHIVRRNLRSAIPRRAVTSSPLSVSPLPSRKSGNTPEKRKAIGSKFVKSDEKTKSTPKQKIVTPIKKRKLSSPETSETKPAKKEVSPVTRSIKLKLRSGKSPEKRECLPSEEKVKSPKEAETEKKLKTPKKAETEKKLKTPKKTETAKKLKTPKKSETEMKLKTPKKAEIEKLKTPKKAEIEKKLKTPKRPEIEKELKTPKKAETEMKLKTPKKAETEKKQKAPKRPETEKELKTPKKAETEMKLKTPKKAETDKKLKTPKKTETDKKLKTPKRRETEKELKTPKKPETGMKLKTPKKSETEKKQKSLKALTPVRKIASPSPLKKSSPTLLMKTPVGNKIPYAVLRLETSLSPVDKRRSSRSAKSSRKVTLLGASPESLKPSFRKTPGSKTTAIKSDVDLGSSPVLSARAQLDMLRCTSPVRFIRKTPKAPIRSIRKTPNARLNQFTPKPDPPPSHMLKKVMKKKVAQKMQATTKVEVHQLMNGEISKPVKISYSASKRMPVSVTVSQSTDSKVDGITSTSIVPTIRSRKPISSKSDGGVEKIKVSDEFEENEVSDEFEENEVSDEFEENEVSGEFEEHEMSSEREENEVSGEAEENEVSGEAEENEVSGEAEENEVSGEAEENEVSGEAEENEVSGEAEENEVSGEAEDEMSDEAEDNEVAGEAEDEMSDEAEDNEVAGEAEENEVAGEAEENEVADEAEENEVADEAEENEVVSEAEENEVSTEAEKNEVSAEAEEINVFAKPQKINRSGEPAEIEVSALTPVSASNLPPTPKSSHKLRESLRFVRTVSSRSVRKVSCQRTLSAATPRSSTPIEEDTRSILEPLSVNTVYQNMDKEDNFTDTSINTDESDDDYSVNDDSEGETNETSLSEVKVKEECKVPQKPKRSYCVLM